MYKHEAHRTYSLKLGDTFWQWATIVVTQWDLVHVCPSLVVHIKTQLKETLDEQRHDWMVGYKNQSLSVAKSNASYWLDVQSPGFVGLAPHCTNCNHSVSGGGVGPGWKKRSSGWIHECFTWSEKSILRFIFTPFITDVDEATFGINWGKPGSWCGNVLEYWWSERDQDEW